MRLRAPPFPRAGLVFPARSFTEQRLGADRNPRGPELDRHGGSFRFRLDAAVFRNRRVSADDLSGNAGYPLVRFAEDPVSGGEDPRRGLADDVRSGIAGFAAGQFRWLDVIPIEGLMGRVVGDVLIHYFNVAGAYIVCASVLAVALYLSTAFSFSSIQLWAPTRFAFVTALWNRYQDWQEDRAKRRQLKELDKRRVSKPVVKTQLIPSRQTASAEPTVQPRAAAEPRRTGIERMFEPEPAPAAPTPSPTGGIISDSLAAAEAAIDPEVTQRADSDHKAKTTMPKIAGGYKLPSSSLRQRPDEQQAVDADELKILAQVLTEKIC